MCGIAGLITLSGRPTKEEMKNLVTRMADTMVHRGPDSSGVWVDPTGYCAFSHRRLSILDLSPAGHQPMESRDKRFCMTFNGEIYNYLELRPEIEAHGYSFHTRTDTEVLIEALRLWGSDTFLKLDGMYAFGVYDAKSKELLLGRDPFGEKPLYYISTPEFFAFASELQALQTLPFFDSSVGLDELAEYLCFQYIGASRTLYRSVKKIPPGHYLTLGMDGTLKLNRYFEFKPGQGEISKAGLNELADELEDILTRSIRRRMIADVPLGAFLSGGVDSSTVVALIRKVLGVPVKTFSVGFSGTDETEHLAARKIAKHLGTEHHEKILTPDASNFLYKIGGLLDEPNGDSSCLPTYLLSQFAREKVTVAISGDGGDEMFGGYGRYFATLEEAKKGLFGWHAGKSYYSSRILFFEEDHIKELFGFVPDGLKEVLKALRDGMNMSEPPLLLNSMRKTDIENYMPGAVLPKVDRMSMQHSLEVRTPFLNLEVARFAEKLPLSAMYDNRFGKLVLRTITCRYIPSEIVNTPKKGFGLPMSGWGREDLLKTAGDLLESNDSSLMTSLGKGAVSRFMERQRNKYAFSTYQVWAICVLESYLKRRPASLASARQGLLLENLPIQHPDCHEIELYARLLKEKKKLVLFSDGYLPFFVRKMPAGSFLVSRPPLRSINGIECVQLDWVDNDLSWVKSLPEEKIRGAIAVFCSGTIFHNSRALVSAFKDAGFKEIIFSNAFGLNGCTIGLSDIKRIGIALGQKPTNNSTHNNNGAVFQKISRKSPATGKMIALMVRPFAHRLGTENRPIVHERGCAYKSSGWSNAQVDQESAGGYVLFEDATPLSLPASIHEDIRMLGQGRYSFWNSDIVFSASDNSDPVVNGRKYYLLSRRVVAPIENIYDGLKNVRCILNGSYFSRKQPVNYFSHLNGYAYGVPASYTADDPNTELSSKYILFENEKPLTPALSHEDICYVGKGRYSVWNNHVVFSSSDNSDPNHNGRSYSLVEIKSEHADMLGLKNSGSEQEFLKLFAEAVNQDNRKVERKPFQLKQNATIALFTHALSSGGAERQWCYLARELEQRGYAVTLIVQNSLYGQNGHYLPLLKGSSVKVRSIHDDGIADLHFDLSFTDKERVALLNIVPSYLSKPVAQLLLYLREIKPACLLCQLDSTNIIGGIAGWFAEVPRILLSTRNMNPSHFPQFYSPWYKNGYLALSQSSRVVLTGNSRLGNNDYADWLGIPHDRFTLIRNGFETTAFDRIDEAAIQSVRKELGLSPGNPIIIGVFRLSNEKQPFVFLRVVELIHQRQPALNVILVGEGHLQSEVQDTIRQKKLDKVVHLLGRRSDVGVLIKAADILLLTSKQEGTPNVVLEAQYLGVPVVATNVGGVANAMKEGITGFICSPDDPEYISQKCLELLHDEKTRKSMGQAGREFVKKDFSMESLVQKTLGAIARTGE